MIYYLGIWLSLRDLRPTTLNSFWRGRIFFLDPIFDTQKRLSKITSRIPFWLPKWVPKLRKIDKNDDTHDLKIKLSFSIDVCPTLAPKVEAPNP